MMKTQTQTQTQMKTQALTMMSRGASRGLSSPDLSSSTTAGLRDCPPTLRAHRREVGGRCGLCIPRISAAAMVLAIVMSSLGVGAGQVFAATSTPVTAHGPAVVVAAAGHLPFHLAWRPFLDPLDLHDWWWVFLFPAVFLISMGYKAIRLPSLQRYWPQVIKLTLQVSVSLIAISLLLFAIVEWVIPRLPVE